MKILLISLFLFPLFAASQILHEKDGEVMYTEVINVDSAISKTELFNRAKVWFSTEYKSGKDVIQVEDKDAGMIVGKGIFKAPLNFGFLVGTKIVNVSHTVKLLFKDGKYRYEITGLSGEYFMDEYGRRPMPITNRGYGSNEKNYDKFLYSVNTEILGTISDLKEAMSKSITVEDF